MDPLPAVRRYVRDHAARMLRELQEFVRFPSVSGQAAHASDLEACARWLATRLQAAGMSHVLLSRQGGPPVVLGQLRRDPARPTLLIYGHYDVQPVEPIQAWSRPPFSALVEGEYLFGRGSSDDKGQLFAHVKAIEAYSKTEGTLPVNLVCLFEGEEETGSEHLSRWLERAAPALSIDAAVVSDTRMIAPGRPAITCSLRGALDLELVVSTQTAQLHSGHFGGIAPDAARALCAVTARLMDGDGRIALPRFYDRVLTKGRDEREYMRATGPSDAELLAAFEAPRGAVLVGEHGFSGYERVTVRPSLTVTGLSAGYMGPGRKGTIPNRASARLNFRLVPDQDPEAIERALRQWLVTSAPAGVKVSLRQLSASRPVELDRHHPLLRVASRAYRFGFGRAPVCLRSGGTVPIVSWLRERLGVPVVLMGFALPFDRMHATDERMHIPGFFAGILTSAAFLRDLGRSARAGLGLRRRSGREESMHADL